MSINILHTNLFTFPVVLRKITWLTIGSWKWQSFPLFLWPTYFIQGWYYKEKLEDSHSEGFKGWLAWFFTKNKACETVIWTDFLHMMLYNKMSCAVLGFNRMTIVFNKPNKNTGKYKLLVIDGLSCTYRSCFWKEALAESKSQNINAGNITFLEVISLWSRNSISWAFSVESLFTRNCSRHLE